MKILKNYKAAVMKRKQGEKIFIEGQGYTLKEFKDELRSDGYLIFEASRTESFEKRYNERIKYNEYNRKLQAARWEAMRNEKNKNKWICNNPRARG